MNVLVFAKIQIPTANCLSENRKERRDNREEKTI
jgi:hypothetical protein